MDAEQHPTATIERGLPADAAGARKRHFNSWTRRTDTPTYEVVGALEQFDQRDLVSSRLSLQSGTPVYREYYARHPELEARDKRLRVVLPTREAQRWQQAAIYRRHPLALALSSTDAIAHHLLAASLDGQPAERKVVLEPTVASKNIKGVARYLGADLVGISELNPAWVYSHRGQPNRWGEPIHVDHHYAISLAVGHDFNFLLASRGFSLASNIETEQVKFTKADVAAFRLASYIQALGYPAQAHVGGDLVLAVPLAVDAGLGEVSRPGLLITKRYGPAVRLSTVSTDLPMEVDKPVDLGIQDVCAKCKKCAVVCPVRAITFGEKEVIRGVRLWPFDAWRCLRLRRALGNTPCMYCLSACPWTKPRNIVHQATAEMVVRLPFSRYPLIWLDDFLYGRKPRLHLYPNWLEVERKPTLKQRIITLLHKL